MAGNSVFAVNSDWQFINLTNIFPRIFCRGVVANPIMAHTGTGIRLDSEKENIRDEHVLTTAA